MSEDLLNELQKLKDTEAALETTAQSDILSNSPDVTSQTLPAGWDADTAVFLAIAILVFGLIVFVTMAILLAKKHRPDSVLKICALPLVIVSAIFLVVIGYSQQQISPVLALLSAIAGYLLGNNSAEKER